ncbi:MAG: phenylalanine--tRNA ligase subunit beta [Candidatus Omnitrophica bacterium]|nr:phenylalanine--tRNA ligase subunit beta [Candidatus Omnitrophota bacterium]
MKVTYNWLKDFVDIRISPRELADKLTMAGLEVAASEAKKGDFIFEIEVTSNRPDCLSVVGIAREVAAITGKKLKIATSCKLQATRKNLQPVACGLQPFSIKIEDNNDCPLYIARIIKDVKVGPSPDWLKERLELIGCRSVNSVVDITNYILFSWGEPLHAFDLDKLQSREIIVRRAQKGEKIITIDGEQRILTPDILVIADKEKPIAIAGIMGGEDTEVTENTKNILLEAAVFNSLIIRRERQRLGLQSESAYRFERGIDLGIVNKASFEAAKLIQGVAGGKPVIVKHSGSLSIKRQSIKLELSNVEKLLGVDIGRDKIKRILNNLGLKTKTKSRNDFKFEVPSHRADVSSEIDLIEEIARISGYENIPKSSPAVSPQVGIAQMRDMVSLTKNILVGLGLNEVITYSFVDKELLKAFGIQCASDTIEIANPLNREQRILRPNLIPSLASCISYNLNQKQEYINIFEIAKVFSPSSQQENENLALGIAICGVKSLLLEQGLIKDAAGFLHLKGILEVLFKRLGISDYSFTMDDTRGMAVSINREKIGLINRLGRESLDHLDIKNKDVFVLELSLDRLLAFANLRRQFKGLPKYPGISRDISVVLKEDIAIDAILKAMRDKGLELLKEVEVVDYYKGKQIPSGFRGLTISCLYRSDERTLTEAEVNPVHALVCRVLIDRFRAQIR